MAEADIQITVGPGGIAQILVEGADLTAFVTALGLDCVRGEPARVVLEGAGRLEVAMRKVEIQYRKVPLLGPGELAALREACSRGWENVPDLEERCTLIIDRLEEVAARAQGRNSPARG